MSMSKFFPVALILIGIALGIIGFNRFDESGMEISIGNMEMSASDEEGRTVAYVLMGLGVISLGAGIGMLARSRP
jgi:hypothetical protein